ncbi:uncharacterized protein LOC126656595 [Mercurialis annua]|uniref:uncharacterized protein LOC126656595 n=1 Tax=Mercurialis annua TaxID=3986 RepID=UPI00215FC3C1|nr:uncharacterized protein LOC126656595 [Mercurialis annua]
MNMKKLLYVIRADISSLPSVIIIEILSRLDIKSVMRCKMVCKQWNSLIQEQYFINKHMHRSIFFNVSWRADGGGSQEFELIAHCFGVFVERSNGINVRYRIQNPATKQLLDLPTPNFTANHQISICYDYTSQLCKLISAYSDENYTRGGCEILTLGGAGDLSWRILEIPCLNDLHLGTDKILFNLQFPDWHKFHLLRIRANLAQVITIILEDETVFINTLPLVIFKNMRRASNFSFFAKGSDLDGNVVLPGFAMVARTQLKYIYFYDLKFVLLEDSKKNKFCEPIIIRLDFVEGDKMWSELEPLFCINDCIYFAKGNEAIVYNCTSHKREFTEEKIVARILLTYRRSYKHWKTYSLLNFKGM